MIIMSDFLGYRIHSTDISHIESILRKAKANLQEAAKEEYHRFLSDEICELVDDITLNVQPRPNISILNAATALLNERIGKAEFINSGTEYDLRAGVSIIPDENDTYLMLSVSNDVLRRAFEDTPEIEDYTISEKDASHPVKNEVVEKWDTLRKRCEEKPILLSATLTNRMEVDADLLHYETPILRAKTRARRSITSRLLNQYACGKEIQAHELMLLMDKALNRMLTQDMQEELEAQTGQLAATLIEITPEIVALDPSAPVLEVAEEVSDDCYYEEESPLTEVDTDASC